MFLKPVLPTSGEVSFFPVTLVVVGNIDNRSSVEKVEDDLSFCKRLWILSRTDAMLETDEFKDAIELRRL